MANANKCWEIKNAAGDEPVEILLYGELGDQWWDEANSKDFAMAMQNLRGKEVRVRINSVGGSVWAGSAMYSTIKQHDKKVTVYIDGLAASAASIVAMAGDEVIMPSNAMMMIHNPATGLGGEAKDFRKAADFLDKVRDTLITAYEGRTALTKEELIVMMDEETWLTAAEAKEYGFVDTVEGTMAVAASMNAGQMTFNGVSFSLDRFKTVPTALLAAVGHKPQPSKNTGISAGDNPEKKETQPMDLEKLKAEHTELHNKVLAEGEKSGVEKERARIKAIQEMSMKGHEELVNKAIDDGTTVEAFAVAMVRAEKDRKDKFLQNRQGDAADLDNLEAEGLDGDDAQNLNQEQKDDKAAREKLLNVAKNVSNRKRKSLFSRKED